MKSIDKLLTLLGDKTPCILIETTEEEQVVQEILDNQTKKELADMNIVSWNCAEGFKILFDKWDEIEPKLTNPRTYQDPSNAIKFAHTISTSYEVENKTAWIFKDIDAFLVNSEMSVRALRNIKEVEWFQAQYNPFILLSTTSTKIPDSIAHLVSVIRWDYPDKDEIEEELRRATLVAEAKAGLELVESEEEFKPICEILHGMTLRKVQYLIKSCVRSHKKLLKEFFLDYKINVLKDTAILSYAKPKVTLDQIGGHAALKTWLKEQVAAFSKEAREYGVDMPKGTMLLGVAGTGKTIMAEALASMSDMPLITLNLNNILGQFLGQSERNIVKALDLVKASAPCVLLIDECEKQFSGIQSSGICDSGVTARVFQQVLSFLNENESGVYVVMTANDVSQLPPELTRAGRLDAQWFFDFPSTEEREAILDIHLSKKNKEIPTDVFNEAVTLTKNFTGAEIQQVVKNMVRISFIRSQQDGDKTITRDDVLKAIHEVIPVYQTSTEKIAALKAYCDGRARKTNEGTTTKAAPKKQSRILDFDL